MESLSGTWRLLRLAIRRDRITLPLTLALTILLVAASAPALAETYDTFDGIISYVASAAPSVVGRVFQGTVQGPTLGSILMAEVFIFGAAILGIMSVLIVSRHTRHNEETGAGELIGSGIVGRSAPLTAAMLLAILANGIAGAIIYIATASVSAIDDRGALFMSLSLTSFGIVMASVAAVAVQLSDYRRGANLLSVSALGTFFIIRGFGDAIGDLSADGLSVTSSWVSWLSPMGWSVLVLPFSENRLYPIVMMLGLSVGLMVAAYYLLYRRDIGSSVFASKPGPSRAAPALLSAPGLALRLQKSNSIAWTVGYVAAGIILSVVINDFRDTFEQSDVFQQWVETSGAGGESFLSGIIATMFPLMTALLSGYVVAAVVKMQEEESSGRLEYLLGTALGRVQWLFSHANLILLGTIFGLSAMGAAAGITHTLASDSNTITAIDLYSSSIINLPAIWLFTSIIVLVFALRGRSVKAFAWSYYAYCALIESLAGIFQLPDWVGYASPFTHTPTYPTDSLEWLPLLVMSGVAIALFVLSSTVFTQRDMNFK